MKENAVSVLKEYAACNTTQPYLKGSDILKDDEERD